MFDADQLDELEAAAFRWLTTGRWTSISGGAKSGTKDYPGDPNSMLMEIKYARRQLGLLPARVSKTYGEFTGLQSNNPPFNEQV